MKLSIIIPVYNTAEFIKDCIDSLRQQKNVVLGEDYEIICVNDGSTDDSLAVLTHLERDGTTGWRGICLQISLIAELVRLAIKVLDMQKVITFGL